MAGMGFRRVWIEMDKYQKAADTKKKKYGEDWFKLQGSKGGRAKVPKGFAVTGNAKEMNKRRIDIKNESAINTIEVRHKV